MRGLVDVDIAFLDDLTEGLDADRELLQRRCHWARPRHGRHAPSLDLARYRGQPCPQPAGDRPSLLMGSPTRGPPSGRCRPLRTHDGPSNAAWSAQRTLQAAASAARITMDPQNPQGPLCGPSALPAPAARRCFRPLASLLADMPGSNRGHVRPLGGIFGPKSGKVTVDTAVGSAVRTIGPSEHGLARVACAPTSLFAEVLGSNHGHFRPLDTYLS